MSHQDRRDPLPKGYQYEPWNTAEAYAAEYWSHGISLRFIRQYSIDSDKIVTRVDAEALRITQTAYGWGV